MRRQPRRHASAGRVQEAIRRFEVGRPGESRVLLLAIAVEVEPIDRVRHRPKGDRRRDQDVIPVDRGAPGSSFLGYDMYSERLIEVSLISSCSGPGLIAIVTSSTMMVSGGTA